MIDSGKFGGKNFLLIDKGPKNKNDRTWCFWEKEAGYYEAIVYKRWKELLFKSGQVSIFLDAFPYEYKMIRGIDFYEYCFSKIRLQPNIHIEYGEISFGPGEQIKLNNEILPAGDAIVFNSIYLPPAKKEKNKFYLLQHFMGWVIETPADEFNAGRATLMDFSVPQEGGTAFAYVLPLLANKALVEFTLFTEKLLPKERYEAQLREYINKQLNIRDFTVTEREFGIIPMTNSRFTAFENGLFNIGTAGGQTKASTGYTFRFIQKQAVRIVEDLIQNGYPDKKTRSNKRFHFYDSTLLHILSKNKLEGKEVFTRLFKKNKASAIFTFLDNESNVKEELKIISTLPTREFLSAGIREFFKML